MAAITSAALCSASAGVALPHGSSAQSLGSQNAFANAPLLPALRFNVSRRRAATCIKAVKNDNGKDRTSRQRAGLAGLLLPSVAAMLIGGTPFAPEARAEMSSADYYKSLMESVRKSQTQAPAPFVAPVLVEAPPVAAAAVTTATPVAATQAAAPAADDDILSLFSSALTETPKKGEAPKAAQAEQPNAPTAAELRAKRVEEVAKREREEAEKKAAEQAQEAKAQAEAKAKEAAAKAEKEAEEKAKEASERLKAKRAQETAKGAAEAAKSKKTHGYLPLFLAQFLVLALYAGAITVAFFLPASQSKKIEATINELSKKLGPLVEKVKPLADQAVAAGNKLAKRAQPLVGKAAQQAVPLVKKAVDASKPLVSQAQAKAGEALEKVKASQES